MDTGELLVGGALAFEQFAFFVEDPHSVELIRPDIVQADTDSHVERRAEVEGAADQQAGRGVLRFVELVLGAVIAAPAFGRIRAEPGFAQFFAAERPMDEVAQGGLFGPLPG